MGEPNAIWRLTSALYSIVKAKELLQQCTKTADERVWANYFLRKCGAPTELASIIDDRLSTHAYLADRILEFSNKNLKIDVNFKEVLKNPNELNKRIKVFNALYSAIFKLLQIELKKLRLNKETIKQNAYKILNENDPFFEPVIKYFQEVVLETKI